MVFWVKRWKTRSKNEPLKTEEDDPRLFGAGTLSLDEDGDSGGNPIGRRPAIQTASALFVFFLLILILTLNVADSMLTMMITDLGGKEYNPVVRSVMALYGHHFWIWKFALVSLSLILLMIHRGYRLFRRIIIVISFGYLLLVIYEIFLVTQLRRFFG